MEEFVTACPRNCYSTCSFRIQVDNNKIISILPYSGNLATPEGLCIKGLTYIERTYSPVRIIYPLIRTAKGKFEQIAVNEALDIISDKLNSIKQKYGSKSILWYRGSGMSGLTNEIGYSFWKAFGGTTITYGNLCWPAGLEAVRLTGALALAVAWVIIKENLTDQLFIEKYVKGYNEFSQSLHITPAEASIITGIPVENIVELAYIIGKEGPVTILPGYGLQRHKNGGQTIRSILSLNILTGNIGRPGTGFNYANLQSYIYDNIKEPLSYYPEIINDTPFRRTISMTKLGADIMATRNPEIKAAWIERGNPLLQSPDSNSVRKALSGLEFKIIVEQFMTDTAAICDIILPAKDMFEQSDIIGSYWSPYIQYKPKVIEPPGEVIPESEIYFKLAERLSMKLSSDDVPEPGNINIEKWLENRIAGYSDLTLEILKA